MSKKQENNEEQRSLEEIENENNDLYNQLTNKNKDYIFQINTRLEELEYDPVKKEYVLNQMFHEMIKAQEESITARKLYGTPTERVDIILGNKVEIPEGEQGKSPLWMRYMDGALLLGGIFALINGIASLRGGPDSNVGLLQILTNFLLGGLAALVLAKYAPRPGQSKGFIKYIAATFAVMFIWILVVIATQWFSLTFLNPILPGEVIIGIGAIALVAKWYLKKQLDIQGTLF